MFAIIERQGEKTASLLVQGSVSQGKLSSAWHKLGAVREAVKIFRPEKFTYHQPAQSVLLITSDIVKESGIIVSPVRRKVALHVESTLEHGRRYKADILDAHQEISMTGEEMVIFDLGVLLLIKEISA